MSTRKWTKEIRILLYQGLVNNFGPYHTWEIAPYPKNRKEDYNKFLEDFSTVVSILSGNETTPSAVQSQINWALTAQEKVERQSDLFILNMAAAYETGFIRSKDLPILLLVERKKII